MRTQTFLFATFVCALCVSSEPIPLLNKDKAKSSMATISFEKQLEETDVKQFNAEIKNMPKLHLADEVEGPVEPAADLTDNESLKKRAARQVVITATFPYTYYPYVYYPSVYSTSSVNYYRASIFPFLGI